MVLDSRIQKVKDELSLTSLEDWQRVTPSQILAIDDVGPVTLDHVRLYLAGRNVTLQGDMTPAYWQQHLDRTAICHKMTEQENCDVLPFAIIVDSNERNPYGFQGIRNPKGREWIVPTITQRLPEDEGDYKVAGIDDVTIEKKEDAAELYSTLGARDEFEKQVAHMHRWLRASFIVIGSSWQEITQPGEYATPLRWIDNLGILEGVNESGEVIWWLNEDNEDCGKWNVRNRADDTLHAGFLADCIQFCERRHTSDTWRSQLHPRSVWGTINSWRERYPRVHWIAAGSRRLAELTAFEILEKTWRHTNE